MPLMDEEADALVRRCDVDGDGGISYHEFLDGLSREHQGKIQPDLLSAPRPAPTLFVLLISARSR